MFQEVAGLDFTVQWNDKPVANVPGANDTLSA